MTDVLGRPSATPFPFTPAALIAVGGAGALGAALFFQHVLGYQPCAMCLWQRWAYYIGIPLAIALAAAAGRAPRTVLVAGFILLALLFLGNAGLGAFHSGVEWKWWPGPTACSVGGGTLSTGNLLEAMQNRPFVGCDTASWRLFGLSFAGWNALISLVLAAIACLGLRGLAARN